MSEPKNKAWLIKRLNELRKSCSNSAVPPDKGYYTAKAQAYKKAIELAECLESPVEVVRCVECVNFDAPICPCASYQCRTGKSFYLTSGKIQYCSSGERKTPCKTE